MLQFHGSSISITGIKLQNGVGVAEQIGHQFIARDVVDIASKLCCISYGKQSRIDFLFGGNGDTVMIQVWNG
eukprot:11384.XXX_751321_751536_1 [CDS] Oithona nana genome sequencing.